MRSIILRKNDKGEADEIVTFLSRECGWMSGIAKNSKKSRIRFGGNLEPFSVVELNLRRRKRDEFVWIDDAAIVRVFNNVRLEIEAFAWASYFLELASIFLAEAQPDERLFDFLEEFLSELDTNKLNPPFMKKVKIVTYKNQKEKMLKTINSNRSDYLVVCTGHQGEPGSVLDRLSRHQLPLKIQKEDHVIFSSRTIPSPINELNREQLQKRLKKCQARIFDGIHVSGHGGREDLRDLIKLTNPEHIIPSHGDLKKLTAGADLAQEMGYHLNKTVHLMQNGQFIKI